MFYFPHQGLRWQLLIVLHCHIIMGGYEGQRGRPPFIQINYQPYFANRNWRSLRKNSGRLSSSLSPSQTFFFPVNESYSVIGNIGSLNSGERVGIQTEFTTLEWDASQNKQNNHRNRKYGGRSVGETPPPTHVLLQTSSCTSRGWVDEALLPTELIRTEWSTMVLSWLGLQFAKLE